MPKPRTYLFVSGGQTGVDRGMLDACLEAEFPCGGWCPEGRQAEDGPIDAKYPVQVLPGAGYPERTKENVLDSDGTLVLFVGELAGGTKASRSIARGRGIPYLLLNFDEVSIENAVAQAATFISKKELRKINFSGPRASNWPAAEETTREFTRRLIEKLRANNA